MKRVLCIILGMVALTICFASPAFADGELPGEIPNQYRNQYQNEYQEGDTLGHAVDDWALQSSNFGQ